MAQRNKKLRFPKLPRDVPQGWAAIIAALIALAGTIYTVALQNHSSLSGAPPGASSPMAATALQTSVPASSPVQLPASRLMFATRIAPNGQALDPGTTFPPQITDLYAVFRPDIVPPGMQVTADHPTPDAYYAYLKVKEDSSLSSFGWRWYRDGQAVNEHETAVQPGSEVWLQRYDYSGRGLFGGELGPGTYTVAILLGGNPAMSAELVITP